MRFIRRIASGLSAGFFVFFLDLAELFLEAVECVVTPELGGFLLVWETAGIVNENSSRTSSADRILTT
jgi:hypothetical protein